jgi:hypothetical protein
MSIDYVRLGLKIPEWAEEMLQKEHAVDEKDDGTRQTPMLVLSTRATSENQHALSFEWENRKRHRPEDVL